MKTINDLSKKLWFRLLKVLHIITWALIFLFVSVGSFYVLKNQIKTIDLKQSLVVCLEGNKTLNTFEAVGIDSAKGRYDWSQKTLTQDEIIKIIEICEITEVDRDDGDSLVVEFNIKKSPPIFKILFISIGLLALSVLVEFLMRHTFYYVVLGKFLPNNDLVGDRSI